LPTGTNLQTMINEIKQNFTASVFGFGGAQNAVTPGFIPHSPSSPTNLIGVLTKFIK
jgi:hypothetical protein